MIFARTYTDGDEGLIKVRADMLPEFESQARALPPGPKWTLIDGTDVLMIGGYERHGLYLLAWLLPGEGLTPRAWAVVAARIRSVIAFARGEGLAVRARVSPVPRAESFLRHFGFTPSPDGDFTC